MDEFGVLTERYGLKPQGKAAPMAAVRRPPNATNSQTRNFGVASASNPKSSSNSAWGTSSGSYQEQKFGDFDDYDILGGLTKPSRSSANHSAGSSLDYDSIFNPGAKLSYDNDDIFSLKNSTGTSNNDVFASFPPPPPPRRSSPVADLLGDDDDIFSVIDTKLNPPSRNGSVGAVNNSAGFDDLIPGFDESIPSNNGYANQRQQSTSSTTSVKDPFDIFGSVDASPSLFSDPLDEFVQFWTPLKAKDDGDKEKSGAVSSIDELEEFVNYKGRKNIIDPPPAAAASPSSVKRSTGRTETKSGTRSNSVPKSRIISSMNTKEVPSNGQSKPVPPGMKKASSATDIVDDLFPMFRVFGDLEEVEDETEERRRIRLGRLTKTQQRMEQAVADMKHRDFQAQQEQEERRRIAETLDIEIKRWAAGKEGNMRALLSSLQYVLWSDCGWEPVPLTDLITSGSVKKVYNKAKLCVHPDKVQQKGATIEQKYTAGKVFDILQEAWKKFSAEELR